MTIREVISRLMLIEGRTGPHEKVVLVIGETHYEVTDVTEGGILGLSCNIHGSRDDAQQRLMDTGAYIKMLVTDDGLTVEKVGPFRYVTSRYAPNGQIQLRDPRTGQLVGLIENSSGIDERTMVTGVQP